MSRRLHAQNDRESLIDQSQLSNVEVYTPGKKILLDFRKASWSEKFDESNELKDKMVSRSFQDKALSTCSDDESALAQDLNASALPAKMLL